MVGPRTVVAALAVIAGCADPAPPSHAAVVELTPPRLLRPAAGARTGAMPAAPDAPIEVRFAWTPVRAATPVRYQLELDDGCAPGELLACRFAHPLARRDLRDPELIAPVPSQRGGRRYAWRVRACAVMICSPWTRPRWLEVGRALADLDGDGYADVAAGAPLADGGGRDRGAVMVIHGGPRAVTPRNQRIDEPSATDDANFGVAVALVGDLDGDGLADLVVGAPGDSDGRGRAWLIRAGAPPRPIVDPDGQPGDWLGAAVAGAGDLDGDGFADLAIAAPGADGATADEVDRGKVLVYRGGPGGLADAPPVTLTVPSPRPDDHVGAALAGGGDVDGDGYADLAIGAAGMDRAGATVGVDRGAVYLYRGGPDGLLRVPQRLEAPVPLDHDRFGWALALNGDLDGDGRADLVIGAPSADDGDLDGGTVYVFRGGDGGVAPVPSQVLGWDRDAFARFGTSLAIAGDLDGDGVDDLAVGTSGGSGGTTLIYRGGREGLAGEPAVALIDPERQRASDFGDSVAGAGDHDGDGRADLVVGAASAHSGTRAGGRVTLYHGAPGGLDPTPVEILGPAEQAHFGRTVAGR